MCGSLPGDVILSRSATLGMVAVLSAQPRVPSVAIRRRTSTRRVTARDGAGGNLALQALRLRDADEVFEELDEKIRAAVGIGSSICSADELAVARAAGRLEPGVAEEDRGDVAAALPQGPRAPRRGLGGVGSRATSPTCGCT